MTPQCQQVKDKYQELNTIFIQFSQSLHTQDLANMKSLKIQILNTVEQIYQIIDPERKKLRKKLAERLKSDYIDTFKEGLARVRKDNQYFFINTFGEEITTERFDEVGDFSEGLAWVQKDDQYFFINTSGQEISTERFNYTWPFSEGLAWVQKDGKYFFINTSGEAITEQRFDGADNFSEGLARVKKDGQVFYIDKKGKRVS